MAVRSGKTCGGMAALCFPTALGGVVFCIAAVFPAAAQTQMFEGKPVVDIQFTSPQPLAPADLERAQPIRKGQPFHAADAARAIDGLFATGHFRDIAVEAEPSGAGVLVRFVTTNTEFIGGVSIEGKLDEPPNRGEAVSVTQLDLGAPFREEDVGHGAESIRNLLQRNGLYEADVTPRIERDSLAQQVFITYHVKQGKRARYAMPVIHGETKLSESTILRVTGWRIPIIHWWRQVTDARTQGGVRRLLSKYQSQDRLSARVEMTKLDYDAERRRVHPNLSFNPGPKVEIKTVETDLSRRVLKRYVPVFQEGSVNNDLLVEGQRNLREYLQSQGYYDADVDFRVEPQRDDLLRIDYVISRGERFKLTRLVITGNTYFDEKTIRERMFMAPASFTLRRGRYSDAFRRKDEENIANLYRANGFRDVVVNSVVDRNYGGKPGQVSVTVHITEGPQWIVDHLKITGLEQNQDIMSRLSSVPGEPFSEASIASDRDTVLTSLFSDGYPSATFRASWRDSGTPNHVDLVYDVQQGARQYVRGVVTSGLQTTRQSLINQYITLKPGDPLSPIAQSAIQRRYYDLGVFARVDTAIENTDGDTEYKYVLYHFQEANRYTFTFGLGAQVGRFGTPSSPDLSQPAGATGFSPIVSASVNRLNFLGLGHTVTLRGSYSNLQKRASLSYLQPRFRNVDGRNITYTLLYDESLDVRTYASRRAEASVQLSQQFTKALSGLFRLTYRRVSVNNVVIPVLLVPQFLQPVRLGMVSSDFIYDHRDNPADPHRGMYNTANFGLSLKALGSERQFARALVRNATYYALTPRVVLARQTQFGIIAPFSPPRGVSAEQSVPLPERFLGGGADSNRGFSYNQAGPRDTGAPLVAGGPSSQPTGFPLGGNALFFNTVELRFPLLGTNIGGVVFHDMGNVFASAGNLSLRFHQKNDQDFNYSVQAVGFGIRYRTPIGPVRGDFAYSINPPAFLGFSGTTDQLLQCNPNLPASQLPSYCQPVHQRLSHFQFFFSIGETF
jgi:outer membrane protein insertion porin family